jgi:hypothetical protein
MGRTNETTRTLAQAEDMESCRIRDLGGSAYPDRIGIDDPNC